MISAVFQAAFRNRPEAIQMIIEYGSGKNDQPVPESENEQPTEASFLKDLVALKDIVSHVLYK